MRTSNFNDQIFRDIGFPLEHGPYDVGAVVEIITPERFGVIEEILLFEQSDDGWNSRKILKCRDVETGEIFEAEYNDDLNAKVEGYEVNTLWLPLDKAEEFLKTIEEE